jgi:hypothetical protein
MSEEAVLNNTHNYKDATLNVMTIEKLTAARAELRDHCIKEHRTKLKLQGDKPCHGCVTAAMQALRYTKGVRRVVHCRSRTWAKQQWVVIPLIVKQKM